MVSPPDSKYLGIEKLIRKGSYTRAKQKLNLISDDGSIDYKEYFLSLLRYTGEFDESLDTAKKWLVKESDALCRIRLQLEMVYSLWFQGRLSETDEILNDIQSELNANSWNEENQPEIYGKLYHLIYLVNYAWSDDNIIQKYLFRSIDIRKKLGDEKNLALGYNNLGVAYWHAHKLDLSMEYFLKSIEINRSLGNMVNLALTLENLIEVSVLRSDEVSVEKYFNELTKVYKRGMNKKDPYINLYYKFGTAFVLNHSDNFRDKIKAEELFIEVVSIAKKLHPQFYETAVFNLCHIYLFELDTMKNKNSIKKITQLISQLIDFGTSQEVDEIVFKAKLLQAKLLLIQNEYKQAKEILIEINRDAQDMGDKRLVNLISHELDKLLDLEVVIQTIDTQHKSLKLLTMKNLNDLVGKFATRDFHTEKINNEIPVALIMMNDIGLEFYVRVFDEETKINSPLISSFITAINLFSNEILGTDGYIERIQHKSYRINLKKQDQVLYCYIYKGTSSHSILRLDQVVKLVSTHVKFPNKDLDFVNGNDELKNKIDMIVDDVFSFSIAI